MMRRATEGRVEVAGQKFSHVAERVLTLQQDVCHERLKAYVRPAVAVRAYARPAGEEGPDRAVVIRERVVQTALVRDDSRPPVGRHVAAAEVVNLTLRALFVEHMPPERHGWQDCVLVNDLRLVQLVHARPSRLKVRATICLALRRARNVGGEGVEAALR